MGKISTMIGVARLTLIKNGPKIALICGATGIITGVVLACIETRKADKIVQEHNSRIKEIHEKAESDPEYKESKEMRKDIRDTYISTAGDTAKTYTPSAVVLAVSMGLIFWSNGMLTKRYIGAVAAYNGVSEAFQAYRKNFIEEYGEEADYKLRFGPVDETVETVTDTEGNEYATVKKVRRYEKNVGYGVIFDNTNVNWSDDPQIREFFLARVEQQAKDRLNAYGFLLLNDVYDLLGVPRTTAGGYVGWVRKRYGEEFGNEYCDGYVDLGLFDRETKKFKGYIDAYCEEILIAPNVDGVIIDKIDYITRKESPAWAV